MSKMKAALDDAAERLVAAQGATRTERAETIRDAVYDGIVVPADPGAYHWERDGLLYAAHDPALLPTTAGDGTTLAGVTP